MSNPTVSKIIKEIQLRYNAPKGMAEADCTARLLLLADDLEKFDEGLLAKIWDRFPPRYKFAKWPTISDIQKVADEASFTGGPARPQRAPKADEPDERYAYSRLFTAEARRAADEGYAAGFYDWCAKHKTMPTPEDLVEIKTASHRFRAKAREQAAQGRVFADKLVENLERREENMAQKIRALVEA